MSLSIIVLGAGKGTRMYSNIPKVLHKIAKKEMLLHALDTAKSLNPNNIHLVYGHKGELVKQAVKNYEINLIEQKEQLGTAHAVKLAMKNIDEDEDVLILYADVPLIAKDTLKSLLGFDFSLLTLFLEDPTGYGRIVRKNNEVTEIVEQKDASADILKIKEINTGIMHVKAKLLHKYLPKINNNNAQKEYYLTDLVKFISNQNTQITTKNPKNEFETQGVNNKLQLAFLEKIYQEEKAKEYLTKGLELLDYKNFIIRGDLEFKTDVSVDSNCVFEGKNSLGSNVKIGANCVIINSKIKNNAVIKPFCHIENSVIEANCQIGPFARLRENTNLEENVKIGNFVETKNVTIKHNSKVNHLSYVGDAKLGKNVNVGAGTITCNYDGANKHQTIIDDNVFVGSNSSLIAPIKIKKNATIGAGSTINGEVKENSLTVTRAQKKEIINWLRPKKKA